jgi:phosphate transport system substrate-binding protein
MRFSNGGAGLSSASSTHLPVVAMTVLSFLLAACGGASQAESGDGLTGRIVISGSSTVEPISIGVAEKFSEIAPDVDVSVDGPGTGDGFELFCKGETDISDASRAIKEEEAAACAAAGINFIELKVAHDGIAVLTSPENDEVTRCLSFSDIYSLVGPESQGFDRWSDANALVEALGSSKAAPFPDVPLAVTGPGEESGTYDSFVELVLTETAEARAKEPQTRPDYQASADDNVIVQGIQGSGTSLGWVGFAFYEANQEELKAYAVAGEDGKCVLPSPQTISDGSYPISRPLFIYVNSNKLESNPALERFVELYVSEEGLATASEVSYVELNEEEAEASRKAFESRASGVSSE